MRSCRARSVFDLKVEAQKRHCFSFFVIFGEEPSDKELKSDCSPIEDGERDDAGSGK